MEEEFDILWEGKSGREYGFYIVALDPELRLIEEPGVYIVARKLKSGIWEPLFLGRTENFDTVMGELSRNPCIREHHGSHLHVRPFDEHAGGGSEIVRDLEDMWNPVCKS